MSQVSTQHSDANPQGVLPPRDVVHGCIEDVTHVFELDGLDLDRLRAHFKERRKNKAEFLTSEDFQEATNLSKDDVKKICGNGKNTLRGMTLAKLKKAADGLGVKLSDYLLEGQRLEEFFAKNIIPDLIRFRMSNGQEVLINFDEVLDELVPVVCKIANEVECPEPICLSDVNEFERWRKLIWSSYREYVGDLYSEEFEEDICCIVGDWLTAKFHSVHFLRDYRNKAGQRHLEIKKSREHEPGLSIRLSRALNRFQQLLNVYPAIDKAHRNHGALSFDELPLIAREFKDSELHEDFDTVDILITSAGIRYSDLNSDVLSLGWIALQNPETREYINEIAKL